MTNDHMQIRATAIVNDLTKATDPGGAIDVLLLSIYLVAVMAANDAEDAEEMFALCGEALYQRAQNFEKDRETFLRSRGKTKDKDKQAKLIKAMLALGMKQ